MISLEAYSALLSIVGLPKYGSDVIAHFPSFFRFYKHVVPNGQTRYFVGLRAVFFSQVVILLLSLEFRSRYCIMV